MGKGSQKKDEAKKTELESRQRFSQADRIRAREIQSEKDLTKLQEFGHVRGRRWTPVKDSDRCSDCGHPIAAIRRKARRSCSRCAGRGTAANRQARKARRPHLDEILRSPLADAMAKAEGGRP
jgi:RNA polymerase-binding transcription factor DksA